MVQLLRFSDLSPCPSPDLSREGVKGWGPQYVLFGLFLCLTLIPFAGHPQFNDDPASPLDQAWKYVGWPGFSPYWAADVSLAFSPSGEPYVVFRDWTSNPGNTMAASVMQYDGSRWVFVGVRGFSQGNAAFVNMAFSPGGVPHVIYSDGALGGKATVMKFNGTDWVPVGNPGFSAGLTNYDNLYFNPVDTLLYVAFQDRGYANKARVMKYNGSAWVPVGSAVSSAGAGSLAMTISNTGVPFVAYQDSAHDARITVRQFDGIAWVNNGNIAFSDGVADGIRIVSAPGIMLYVAFRDYADNYRITVMRDFDGHGWLKVGSPGISVGEGDFSSLNVSPEGTVYLSFCDLGLSGKVVVKKLNQETWETVGPPGISAGGATYTSLAFDGLGTPHVAYSDNWNGQRVTLMKYDSVYTGMDDRTGRRLRLFPDPVADRLTVELPGLTTVQGWLEVLDCQGKVVYEGRVTGNREVLDVRNYPSGVYFVRLKMKTSVFTGKFIK